ncbi:MAG: hemerythrin domain-containing protein [Arhodomonas sp.]|nr:hemerythrin domain-containing protein [Arhodomonas sp.]
MEHGAVDALRDEHRQLDALLAVLDRQLEGIGDGGSPDFELMERGLDYLCEHADENHHRFEARLLERLAERDPGSRRLTHALKGQRRRLLRDGRQLGALIGQVLAGRAVATRLLAAGTRYLAAYHALIAREEREAFPALRYHLHASDWITLVTSCQWGCGRAWPLGEEPEIPGTATADRAQCGRRLAPGDGRPSPVPSLSQWLNPRAAPLTGAAITTRARPAW